MTRNPHCAGRRSCRDDHPSGKNRGMQAPARLAPDKGNLQIWEPQLQLNITVARAMREGRLSRLDPAGAMLLTGRHPNFCSGGTRFARTDGRRNSPAPPGRAPPHGGSGCCCGCAPPGRRSARFVRCHSLGGGCRQHELSCPLRAKRRPGTAPRTEGRDRQASAFGSGDADGLRNCSLMRWASSSWSSRMMMRQAASTGVP